MGINISGSSGKVPVSRPTLLTLGLLLAGALLWLIDYQIWENSRNVILLAPLLTLGAFLIPSCMAYWFFARVGGSGSGGRHLLGFILGGVIALNMSVAIGVRFLELGDIPLTGVVALSEELAKVAVVAMVAGWGAWRELTVRRAVTIGAAVGYGFAAFETFGYALTSIWRGGVPGEVIHELILRGVLSPLGHGLWTAALAGLIAAVLLSERGSAAKTAMAAGALALFAGVHFLWNTAGSFGVALAGLVSRGGVSWSEFEAAWLVNETVLEQRIVIGSMALIYLSLAALAVWVMRWSVRTEAVS